MIESAIRLEIEKLLPIVREKAVAVGSLHSAWETIFDAEAYLKGRDAEAIVSAETVVEYLREFAAFPSR